MKIKFSNKSNKKKTFMRKIQNNLVITFQKKGLLYFEKSQ